ncbi:glycosyltransferase family 2 protein [Dehalobacterium formicoaceticum]|uniref:glycosyltransferase family 2 protein n=1 Tax=Dehalobacterium formicoaceticum TaxID=51515 RepID=UPI0018DF7174|nr:glycosyltransferase [Dehalobacterium formicoaceticum]
MEFTAVSIIVPIYNVEKYLHQCIDSLVVQTLSNIEIILVDDGSTDQCGRLCDEYALKDARVKVIHQPNAGLSAARNSGIKCAGGEYIGFVDGDDWVDASMFKVLYDAGKEHHCDIVSCNFSFFYEDSTLRRIEQEEKMFISPGIVDQSNIREEIYLPVIKGEIFTSCCNKIYDRKFLEENKILFLEGLLLQEDYYFYLDVFTYMKRCFQIDEPLYYYRNYYGSSRRRSLNNYFQLRMDLHQKVLACMQLWGMGTAPYLSLASIRCLELAYDSMVKILHYRDINVLQKIKRMLEIINDENVLSAIKKINKKDMQSKPLDLKCKYWAFKSRNIFLASVLLLFAKIIRKLNLNFSNADTSV